MDSLTHIAIGACIGEAFFGKSIGKKAMLWGALAQSVPDIDFVAAFWMNASDNLLAHRGFTHSFLFAGALTPFLSLLAERLHRPLNISIRKWMLFFGLQIFIHIFLDAFNSYGVGWFEPFHHKRISFNAIFVADPLFSIWPGIGLAALIFLKPGNPYRKYWWKTGIIMAAIYLGYCVSNKITINNEVKQIALHQKISYSTHFTTPTPLNNWLWYVVLTNESGSYIGYRSVFDTKEKIDFEFFPRNDSLLFHVNDHEELQKLIRFSQGFYTVEKSKDTTVFNDLRFGKITGWQQPGARFVFHFFLEHTGDNKLVIQRARFAKWNWAVIRSLYHRIKGN